MTFEEYKLLFDDFFRTGDTREILLQYDIIRPFLRSVLEGYDIVPTDIQVPGNVHDYSKYCGTYEHTDKNGRKKTGFHTPDLVIARRWHWDNTRFAVDVLAAVEIKSFYNGAGISGIKNENGRISDVHSRRMRKIVNALRHHTKKNDLVILTDGIRWEFYHRRHRGERGFEPKIRIDLGIRRSVKYNTVGIRRSVKNNTVGIEWYDEDKFEKLKDAVKKEVGQIEKIHSLP